MLAEVRSYTREIRSCVYFYSRLIEINSYNTDQRKDTYNVIGIMKGDIEPG